MTGKWAGFGRNFDVNTGPWVARSSNQPTSAKTQCSAITIAPSRGAT